MNSTGTRVTPAERASVIAIAAASDTEEDLDAQIAAAELRVIAGDARVLGNVELLKRRLASHGTQARLGALGAAGAAAIFLLARARRRSGTPARQPAHEAPAQPSRWVPWLALLLQLVSAGAGSPSRPPGMVGWISALLSARRRWRGPGRQPRDAAGASPAAPKAARAAVPPANTSSLR